MPFEVFPPKIDNFLLFGVNYLRFILCSHLRFYAKRFNIYATKQKEILNYIIFTNYNKLK